MASHFFIHSQCSKNTPTLFLSLHSWNAVAVMYSCGLGGSGMPMALWRETHRVVVIGLMALVGCAPGRPPFAQAQICLHNAAEIGELKKELYILAIETKGKATDSSPISSDEMRETGLDQFHRRPGDLLLLGIEKSNGVGLTATNAGLPAQEVRTGFSAGSDLVDGRRFEFAVLDHLKRRWKVQLVPGDVGIGPMKGCS